MRHTSTKKVFVYLEFKFNWFIFYLLTLAILVSGTVLLCNSKKDIKWLHSLGLTTLRITILKDF